MPQGRELLRALRPQLRAAALLGAFQVLTLLSVLPSPTDILGHVRAFVAAGGIGALALVSFTENLFGVSAYFPGSVAILSGMASTNGHPTLGILTFTAIALPAFAAYTVNYASGRAVGRGVATQSERPSLVFPFLAAFWHPHTAAIAAFGAGASGYTAREFISAAVPAGVLWNTFWGLLMYFVGGTLSAGTGSGFPLMWGALCVWLAWGVVRHRRSIALVNSTTSAD